MMAYADYTFYEEVYKGELLNLNNGDIALLHATQYIKHLTLGKSEAYAGDEKKYATCAIAEIYAQVNGLIKTAKGNNAEKKSETTDGYSVSYVTQSKDGESREELFERRAYESAKYWLANTGLLNRRVRSVNKC